MKKDTERQLNEAYNHMLNYFKDEEAGQIFYGCMCKNTGCCMIPTLYMTKMQAIELWNRRIGEQE